MNNQRFNWNQNKILLKILVFLLVGNCFTYELQAQKIADSLKDVSYDYMWERFYADTTRASQLIYTDAIIARTKKEGDTATLMGGYDLRSTLYKTKNDNIYLSYLDSIIEMGVKKPISLYPEKIFAIKASYYYTNNNLQKALKNFILAYNYNKGLNERLNFNINHSLALIKGEMGDKKEALALYKKNIEFFEKKNIDNNRDFLAVNFNISTMYNQLGKLDSARYYIDNGLSIAEKIGNHEFYHNFQTNKGINFYYSNNLQKGRELILKSIDSLKKIQNKAHAYLYLGQIERKLNNENKSIEYFRITDSIINHIKVSDPIYRDAYVALTAYYKNSRNLAKQFYYLNKLIKMDSINHENEVYLNRNLYTDYEIPKLTAERDQVIENIRQKDDLKRTWIIILLAGTIIILSGFIYQFQKRKSYRTRFLALIHQQEEQSKEESVAIENTESLESLDISKDTVSYILDELRRFEQNHEYLQSDLTLSLLAKQINSNTRYLSKVISYHKQKSFIQYINDLRVKYAVDRLKTDEHFRKYTLYAIANDLGFKKTESFTKAFKKVTGITPAYYIKELKKGKYPNS